MGAPIAELLHSSIVPHGIQNTKQHFIVFTLVIYSFFWTSIARIMHHNRAFLLDLCLSHFIRILYAYVVPAKALGIQMNGVATHAACAQAVRAKWQSRGKDPCQNVLQWVHRAFHDTAAWFKWNTGPLLVSIALFWYTVSSLM